MEIADDFRPQAQGPKPLAKPQAPGPKPQATGPKPNAPGLVLVPSPQSPILCRKSQVSRPNHQNYVKRQHHISCHV